MIQEAGHANKDPIIRKLLVVCYHLCAHISELKSVDPASETKERNKILDMLEANTSQRNEALVTAYCRHRGYIFQNLGLEHWPLEVAPKTPREIREFCAELVQFGIERQKQAEPMDLIP